MNRFPMLVTIMIAVLLLYFGPSVILAQTKPFTPSTQHRDSQTVKRNPSFVPGKIADDLTAKCEVGCKNRLGAAQIEKCKEVFCSFPVRVVPDVDRLLDYAAQILEAEFGKGYELLFQKTFLDGRGAIHSYQFTFAKKGTVRSEKDILKQLKKGKDLNYWSNKLVSVEVSSRSEIIPIIGMSTGVPLDHLALLKLEKQLENPRIVKRFGGMIAPIFEIEDAHQARHTFKMSTDRLWRDKSPVFRKRVRNAKEEERYQKGVRQAGRMWLKLLNGKSHFR